MATGGPAPEDSPGGRKPFKKLTSTLRTRPEIAAPPAVLLSLSSDVCTRGNHKLHKTGLRGGRTFQNAISRPGGTGQHALSKRLSRKNDDNPKRCGRFPGSHRRLPTRQTRVVRIEQNRTGSEFQLGESHRRSNDSTTFVLDCERQGDFEMLEKQTRRSAEQT